MRILSRLLVVSACLGAFVWGAAPAQSAQLRAFWVDSWHAGFKTAAQVDTLLSQVRAANCNAVFVQVRRRGQTYYVNNVGDPRWTDVSPSGFDSLAYLIQKAHGGSPRIEVHVWSDGLLIWGSQTMPGNSSHVINEHPEWLTKNSSGTAFDGSNYWLDPGHPGAQQYLVDVAMDVINNYDIDGFHYDYMRFAGEAWGYNATSVSRFNTRYNRTGTPLYTDSAFKQWRRDQVTSVVRKTYASAIAAKPSIKISVATITWGNYSSWTSTSAFSRNYQDWLSWMQEGTVDFVAPMCYYDQSVYPTYYANWINFAKNSRYNRHIIIGQASYENSITNTITQTRSALAPSTTGKYADGIVFYSYAAPSSTGQTLANLIQGLTQPSSYDTITPPVFSSAVSTPTMTWKTSPTKGHMKGTVLNGATGAPIDGALITLSGPASRTQYTDGTGFYAFIDLTPGSYTVTAAKAGFSSASYTLTVTAGNVGTRNFTLTSGGCLYAGISGIQAQGITSTNATIVWATDVASTSQVEYGATDAYGSTTTPDTANVTNHSVSLNGLAPNTLYHYRVISTPPEGCTTYSADQTFKTTGGATPEAIILESRTPTGGVTPAPAYTEYVAWTGNSTAKSAAEGLTGSGSRYATTYATKTASFVPSIPYAGPYDVYVTWGSSVYGANTNFKVISGGTTVYNQNHDQCNAAGTYSQWILLGQFTFAAGQSASNASVMIDGAATTNPRDITTPRLMSDAVKFVFRGAAAGDTEPPTAPSSLAATVVGTDQINLSWGASTDNVGVTGYNVYRGGVLANSTTDPVFFDNGLSPNTSYSYQVSAVDEAGNESALSTAVVAVTLSVPPSTISVASAREPDVWYTTNGFQFAANGGFGPGTISKYRVAWDTSATHVWGSAGEFDWPGSSISLVAAPGASYYLHLQGYNSAGVANGSADLGPYKYDPSAPTVTSVTASLTGGSTTSLSASWTGSDPESGIQNYEYSVGTAQGLDDVKGWTSAGTAQSAVISGLSLSLGGTYYVNVRATNAAGLVSSVASSPGVLASLQFTTAGQAKGMQDGTVVTIIGQRVTAAFDGFFYAGSPGSGIRVVSSTPVTVNQSVTVSGTLSLLNGCERALTSGSAAAGEMLTGDISCGMSQKYLGGEAFNAYTPGVTGGVGLNNIGVLVRVVGRVKIQVADGFYLEDGSGLDDGSGHPGVKVWVQSGSLPAVGARVKVTGISSCRTTGMGVVPLILAQSFTVL